MQKVITMLKNKDVMNRILFTFVIFFIFRIGSALTLPGVTLDSSDQLFEENNVLALVNLMGGGALQSFSIFALGVSPFITAQIIVQLLSMNVLPSLTELSKQGESGRKKINTISKVLSLLLGCIQAYGIIVTMQNTTGLTVNDTSWWGYTKLIIYLVAGSLLLIWLGDQISDKGIGNGISMIIFAGIVSSIPQQIIGAFEQYLPSNILSGDSTLVLQGIVSLLVYLLAFCLIIIFVTFVEKSERRLPVSHSNTSESQTKELNQKASFLPIKINSSGVIPVIFASSVMIAPSIIISLFIGSSETQPYWVTVLNSVFSYNQMTEMPGINGTTWQMPWGLLIYLTLIILFSYFYSNLQINPERIAENFQESGTYITGLRPGVETEKYIKTVLNRVTFMGSFALAFIAALPVVLSISGAVPASLALGGTGLIIVVGVSLELRNQVDGMLAARSYSVNKLSIDEQQQALNKNNM